MKRILLLEDDQPIREAFQLAFKDSEYELMLLDSGDKIMTNDIDVPDVFILDKNISGTDGLEVCKYIKNSETYKHTPVIMLSANPDIVKLADDAGADGVIEKPFSLKKLRETLVGLLK